MDTAYQMTVYPGKQELFNGEQGMSIILLLHYPVFSYQMVSRTNYRRCMAQGWDGNIPVCEGKS